MSGPKRRDVLRPGPMEIRAVLVAARTIEPVARSPRASCEDPARPRSRVGRCAAECLGSLRRPERQHVPEDAVGQADGLEVRDTFKDADGNVRGYLPCIASSPLASSLAAVNSRTRRRIARRECIHCDKTVGLDEPRFRFCARCESPYCSEKCQREHWQSKYSHKTHCSRIRKQKRRKCDVCGLQNRNDQPSFSVCGRCGTRRYCSEECQKEDWEAGHAQKCVGCV